MRLFYEKLYTGKNNIELEQSSLSHVKDKSNKISDNEKEDLEKKTMSELELIIKKLKTTKVLDLMVLLMNFIKSSGITLKFFF